MSTVHEKLLDTLDELVNDDLKRFHWYLTKSVLAECSPIPNSKVENLTRDQTVDLMVNAYTPEVAVDITRAILIKMKNNYLAGTLKTVPSSTGPQHGSPAGPSLGKAFLYEHKAALETRINNTRPILSALEHHGIISLEEREEVESHPTPTKRNVALLAMVIKKGAEEQFYQALKAADAFLVKDLEG
ncbi:hypothetical protein UPYG_G00282640 [Umbra pygmaea]|uniref:Pyrin domain-containing protein n=1 Tax=Umbra pygmaea TaxID=75934 RepID=A0ABD0WPF9_UMBPY